MQNQSTALITGASGGIGKALAEVMAKKGHPLVLVARSKDKLTRLQEQLQDHHGVSVKVMAHDLSQPEARRVIVDILEKEKTEVDILVNNAGLGDHGAFSETDWEKDNLMIQLNITALTHLTKLFLPAMLERKSGRIMNLSSTAAFQPGPLMAVYYATKAYVQSFTEALAHELKGTGVTATALCPGPTASGFQDAANLNEARLVNAVKLPTAGEVALYGYHAMMRGKRVAIHGAMNYLMAKSVNLLPNSLVTNMVSKMHERVSN